jgi:hypothetical protein
LKSPATTFGLLPPTLIGDPGAATNQLSVRLISSETVPFWFAVITSA